MPSSPYVVGQWVRGEKFYGRSELLDEILEGPRNWIWVLGTRRLGKTSLLKQLELVTGGRKTTTYLPIFWDLQGAGDEGGLHRGYREALLDASERFEDAGVPSHELEGTDLFDSLGRLRRRLRGAGLRPLLLCDEVEELILLDRQDPSLLHKLRRCLQSQEDIRTVMASTIRLWDLAEQKGVTSPFLHGFTPPLYLRALTDEEARALVRQSQIQEAKRPSMSDETVEAIRDHCGNHPYLIQILCKRYEETQDLAEAIEQVATDPMVSHFFSIDFEMLSEAARDVLSLVIESNSATSDSIRDGLSAAQGELGGLLHRLQHLGYLRRDPNRRYVVPNRFFSQWFRERPARRSTATPSPAGETAQATIAVPAACAPLLDNRYRLLQEAGRGATGVVYRASDEIMRETIALKILRSEHATNREVLERFRQEILLARDIAHPNIVKIYHLGDCAGQRYLTMRWINGTTLARLLSREGPLSSPRALEIAIKLASALEAAHALSVVHRDVKPQNVLLDDRGEPYLADFGLARLVSAPGITRGGMFVGTPDYASPEQASLLPSDERSDLYSLGVTIFEMMTGRLPFVSDSAPGVLEMHRSVPPPDPRSVRGSVPAEIARIILHCLEKNPSRRFGQARDLRLALEGARSAS